MRNKYILILCSLLLTIVSYGQVVKPIEPNPTPSNEIPIGKTQGMLDVSPTGAAMYTVPIQVPKGVNGVEPQISLAYNSQSGTGIAGFGWSISGLSTISRIPSTLYHDGKVSTVDFSTTDRFALNGQRLLLKSGVYGGDGAEYQTENYSNLKITSHGISPYGAKYGPKYFKVEYPDGSIAMYGYSDSSRSKLEFAITSYKNSSDVVMSYNYITQGNVLLVSHIKYVSTLNELVVQPKPKPDDVIFEPSEPKNIAIQEGIVQEIGNSSLINPGLISSFYRNEIKFTYTERENNKQTSYVGGEKFVDEVYLTQIETKSGGQVYRKYELGFKVDPLGNQILESIKEFNGIDTKELQPINVAYKGDVESVGNASKLSDIPTNLQGDVTANNFASISGDFDGDGVLDYMVYNKFQREYWVYYSTAEQEGQFVYKNIGAGAVDGIFPIQLKNIDNELLPYEGWAEITKGRINVRSLSNGVIKDEYAKTYDFPKYVVASTPSNCNRGGTYDLPNDYFSGDFNGDGITEIIAVQKPKTILTLRCSTQPPFAFLPGKDQINISGGKIYLLNLHDNSTVPVSVGGISDYKEKTQVYTGNFMGNGKTDLLVINQGEMTIYTYDGIKFVKVFTHKDAIVRSDNQAHIGDFNGDGKTDVMFSNSTAINKIFYSTGIGFDMVEVSGGYRKFKNDVYTDTYYANFPVLQYTNYVAADFNNDGKTDIIEFRYLIIPEDRGDSKKGGAVYLVDFIQNEGNSSFGPAASINLYSDHRIFRTIQSRDDKIQYIPIPVFLSPQSKVAYTTDGYRMGLFVNQQMHTFEYRFNQAKNKLIESIQEGDNTFTIKYGQYGIKSNNPADKTDFDYYMKYSNTKEKYPLLELNTLPNIFLVSEINLKTKGESKLKQSFSYASPVVNLQGLGFLGFKGLVKSSWYDKPENMFKNIKEFDIQNRGLLKKESVAEGNQWDSFIPKVISTPSGPISRVKSFELVVDYEYQTELLESKVFKPRLTKVIERNYGGLSVLIGSDSFVKETINTHNQYNDVVKQQVQYKQMHGFVMVGQPGFTLNKTEITENTYSYGAANPNYFMSRLLKSKLIQTIPGESSFATEDSYTYDDKGRVVEAIKKGNNIAETITEKNTYDQYGNIIEKSIKAGNLPEQKHTYKYGYSGRFLVEEIDTENLKQSYTYNSTRGLVTEEKNALGHSTKYMHNNWGQPIGVTDYLGKTTQVNYVKTEEGSEVITTDEEGGWSKIIYDVHGNKTRVSRKNISGTILNQSFEYDAYNRLVKESEGHFSSTPALWNSTTYDKKGRISKLTGSNGKVITTTYTLVTTKVNDGVSTKETKVNAAGHITARKDDGGEIKYTYFSNGNLKSVNYDGVVISLEQDGWGRKTKLIDPSAGTYTYAYNAFGELIKETSPKGTTQFTFDDFGKLTKKQIIGDHTNTEIQYNYKEDTKQLASSTAIVNGVNYSYNYGYDSYNRMNSTIEVTPVATFKKELTFDDFGRTLEEKFVATSQGKSSEKTIKNQYKNGLHWQILDAPTNKILVSKEKTNEYDQLTQLKFGNALEMVNTYDTYGYLKTSKVKSRLVDLFTVTTQFDTKRGNLLSRTNSLYNKTETFTYDNIDRLTSFTNKAGVQETQVYDNKGRITSNNIGDYSYPDRTSYQLESIDLDPSAQSYYQLRPEQQIAYNTFKNPVWIKEEGKENIYFDYNPNNQRSVMYYGDLATNKEQSPLRRYYSADGNIEINHNVNTNSIDFVFYLDGDAYSATLIAKGGVRPDHYYLHRDYLGSILAITDQLGRVVEKRHFDAWGNLVFVKDGQDNDLGQLTFLDRGFTGHEHLHGVALVHMNGRLYDPTVRRFLAPDNFIQDISNTQNFNRYGYVWNNPLVYTDQNGEWVHIAIGAVIGGMVNWAMNGFKFDASGLKAFGIGAAAGALGAATGGIAFTAFGGAAGGVGGFLAGAGAGIVGSVTQTAVLSIGNSMYLGGPALTTKDLLIAGAIGGVTGGLINGGIAASNGRSFWSGANPVAKPLPVTLTPTGIMSKQPDTGLSSSATMKNVPDLAYTNEIKNSVTKVVPLRAVDGGIQGGPLRIPNTTGSTVLEEITINAVSESGKTGLRPVGLFLESVNDVMANPSILRGKSYGFVRNVIGDSQNWVNDVMRKSTRAEGWMLREMNLRGTDFTGRMIQYHPGTPRHFGGTPYWKVSSGNGTFRIPLNF